MTFTDPTELLGLARSMAAPESDLCILAEGNVSARADDETFWVKGSGQMMGSMGANGFSRVNLARVFDAIEGVFENDLAIREALNAASLEGPPPSTETFMHAALLSMPGVDFVAHAHPTPLLSVLCLSDAHVYATRRLFPDEIVCCGPAACFVPYVAPGLELARAIQGETLRFREAHGIDPKTYWLQNHGLIAIGGSAREVQSACAMSVKAARVLLAALQTGKDLKWLTEQEVAHIYNWPDEHARQKALWAGS